MKKLTCILLIDDDETSVFISSMLIESLEITQQLLTAANGKEALELLQQQSAAGTCKPELILVDVNMPVMPGFEFVEALHQLNLSPKPKVYMLSSSFHPRDKQKAQELQTDGFLTKPLTEEMLRSLIAELSGS